MQKQKIPILMYHSISNTANSSFRQFTVSPESFAEQMAYLHHHGYTSISVTQAVSARLNNEFVLPERPVVLTFDDGFADFFIEAFPVLKQYGFTATLYVTTAFLDQTSRWLQHERETTRPMLTWKHLVEISRDGIECGAHSHTHPQLDTLSTSLAQSEILQSKRLLEDHLDLRVCSFAYPFGYYTARVRQLVREAGYTSACAVNHILSSEADDPFSLSRLMVRANAKKEEFATLLTGRSSSPISAVYRAYARTRTPVWQLARRCAASLS